MVTTPRPLGSSHLPASSTRAKFVTDESAWSANPHTSRDRILAGRPVPVRGPSPFMDGSRAPPTERPRGLAEGDGGELDVPQEVSAPHPLRLEHQAVEPFEPQSLHPPGGPAGHAGQDVQRPSHTHHHRNAQVRHPPGHPSFLLRSADPDITEEGPALIQAVDHRPVI